jgi:O-antigen/teichoic acid export membrane protein
MKEVLKKFSRKNPLLANSFNLMVSAGVIALFGFIFWTLVAHSFRSQTVGLATTLLSMSSLLSLLGLAGFDTVFVRFLAKSKQRNEQINSGMIIAGLVSALIAGIFCALIPLLSSKLAFVNHNGWYITSFVIFTVFTTWNTLTNAVLIAYRRTSFVVSINIIFSAIKMSLPLVIHSGGPMTIFAFAGIAQVVNVVLSVVALVKYLDYRPSIKIHFDIVRETLRFGLATYIANILNLLPDSALPLIIVNKLGAIAAAYFFIAFTIANLLYTIAFSTTQALLAETSHNDAHILQDIRKGLRIASGLLVPATIFVIAFCPIILDIFGDNYRNGATSLLRIMSISSLPVMFYSVLGTVFKLTHNLRAILATTATNAVVIVALSLALARPWGLNGVGWIWLIGSCSSVCVGLPFIIHWYRKQRYILNEAS